MSFSIAGKTAIVTGAANGVGLAIGRHFIEQGANVVFADMDEEGLADAVEISEDGQARIFAGDLRQKLNIANLLSATIDAFDRVDILVNAARQVVETDPLDPDDDSVEVLLQQNMLASLKLSRLVAKRMIKQADGSDERSFGSIVNLSSIAAELSHPNLMAYSISSAAMETMTRSLAVALAPNRIRVNAVAFGSVMSASLKRMIKEYEPLRENIIDHTPLGRIAPPRDLAEAVQFLASDGAAFVTGQVLTVDGGRTIFDPVERGAH
ncbi:MAG: SDR family NAD(P)-dependent oxidoreductase [Brevirhabdus sp.]